MTIRGQSWPNASKDAIQTFGRNSNLHLYDTFGDYEKTKRSSPKQSQSPEIGEELFAARNSPTRMESLDFSIPIGIPMDVDSSDSEEVTLQTVLDNALEPVAGHGTKNAGKRKKKYERTIAPKRQRMGGIRGIDPSSMDIDEIQDASQESFDNLAIKKGSSSSSRGTPAAKRIRGKTSNRGSHRSSKTRSRRGTPASFGGSARVCASETGSSDADSISVDDSDGDAVLYVRHPMGYYSEPPIGFYMLGRY